MNNLGVQLYTVRRLIKEEAEIKPILSKLREIGYTSFQLYGNIERIEKLASATLECGANIVGVLVTCAELTNEPGRLFSVCKKYGITDIGVSSSAVECENICEYVDKVNLLAKEARTMGFSFSYHNHSHEFIKDKDGVSPIEYMLGHFTSDVDFMPDTYWLQHGGADIRRFLEIVGERTKILHLKDMKRTKDGHTYAEVGYGNLYFEGIIKTAIECGIRNFVVEQDECEENPLVSLKKSYDYLKELIRS